MEGSLAAGGGHSGREPGVGFARLAARLLLPHGFPSQVTSDGASKGLGRFRALWDSNTVATNGRVDFPKEKLAHQCPGQLWGDERWCGVASPGHLALLQELLLKAEPRWCREESWVAAPSEPLQGAAANAQITNKLSKPETNVKKVIREGQVQRGKQSVNFRYML